LAQDRDFLRELENAVERAMVLAPGDTLRPEDFSEAMHVGAFSNEPLSTKYSTAIEDAKRQVVLAAFKQCGGNYVAAAKALGLHPNSLLRLVRSLGLRSVLKPEC
jgi:two-component system, NtrC family, response regulator HydG